MSRALLSSRRGILLGDRVSGAGVWGMHLERYLWWFGEFPNI